MDEWTCQRDNEVMKRNSTEINDDSDGQEEEDEDVGGDDVAGGHVATASDNLTAADNITFTQPVTQPVTLAFATPPVNTQPAVVNPPIDGQGTAYVTSSPSFMSTDRASITTCAAQGATVTSRPQSRYVAATTHSTPQHTLKPTLQSRWSDGGLGVSFAHPPTLASTPQLLSVHAAPPVDLSMGRSSSMPHGGPGAYAGGDNSSQWA